LFATRNSNATAPAIVHINHGGKPVCPGAPACGATAPLNGIADGAPSKPSASITGPGPGAGEYTGPGAGEYTGPGAGEYTGPGAGEYTGPGAGACNATYGVTVGAV
jgi:hypothetical protein